MKNVETKKLASTSDEELQEENITKAKQFVFKS